MRDQTYAADHGLVPWIGSHTNMLLFGWALIAASAVLWWALPDLFDAGSRFGRWLGRTRVALWLALWWAEHTNSDAQWNNHTSAGLGILDHPDEPDTEAGEGETGEEPEPYDPLTSPIEVVEATPLHDSLGILADCDVHSTIGWRLIDVSKVKDPGPEYTTKALGSPVFAELDKAGVR